QPPPSIWTLLHALVPEPRVIARYRYRALYGARLLRHQLEVFVRGGVRVVGDQSQARFGDAGAVAVDECQLPDRRDRRLVVDELLDPVQDGFALLRIHLACLLADEPFDIGVRPVGEGAARRHEGVEPGGGIAERTARGLDDVLELLLAVLLDERGAF